MNANKFCVTLHLYTHKTSILEQHTHIHTPLFSLSHSLSSLTEAGVVVLSGKHVLKGGG